VIGVILFFSLLAYGCVIYKPPPESWPEKSSNQIGNCPDIAGVYKAAGKSSYNYCTPRDSDNVYLWVCYALDQVLLNDVSYLGYDRDGSEKIRLNYKDKNHLVITALLGNKEVASKSINLAEDRYIKCKGDKLLVKKPIEKGASGGAAGIGFNKVTLMKTEDGGLLAKESGKGGGLFGPFPVFISQTVWYKWELVE